MEREYYYVVTSYTAAWQYTLVACILLTILVQRRFNVSRLVSYVVSPNNFIALGVLFGVSMAGFALGSSLGLEVNLKTILATGLIAVMLADRINPAVYLWLFRLMVVALMIDYVIAYAGLANIHLARYAIRPFGLFLDVHLSGLFFCVALFAFGHRFLAIAMAAVMGSGQTLIVIIYLFFAAKITIRRIPILVLICVITYFFLEEIGHLSVDPDSMSLVNVYIQSFTPESFQALHPACFLVGCSSNILDSPLSYDLLADIGLLRVAYQYGIVWVIVFLYLLRKYDFKYVLAHLISLLHYPVAFGVLGLIVMILNLKYIESLKSKVAPSKRVIVRAKDLKGPDGRMEHVG